MKHPDTCDMCEREIVGTGDKITLTGYKNRNEGGILLPMMYAEKHFCDHVCFEKYATWLVREGPSWSKA